LGRLLIIGLDGLSPELLDSLVKQDVFSNIGALRSKGVYAELKSTFPPVSAPAWTSFATGVNPGKHGIFDFALPTGSLTNLKAVTSKDIAVKTFYEILSEQGKKSILINLPVSWPPLTKQPTLTSLLTQSKELVFPSELKETYPILNNYRITPDQSFNNWKKYIADVRNLERDRFECATSLIKTDWDFFFILFSGTDWLFHHSYDKLVSGKASRELIDFLRELDSYAGKLIKESGGQTRTFIISDHGFNVFTKSFAVNEWLVKEGFLVKSDKSIVKQEKHA